MAWNRPSEAPKVAPKKSPSKMRGIVAGLVVVALASVCAVMFMGKGEKPVEKTTKGRGRIKEVTPDAAPKAKPAPVEEDPAVAALRKKYPGEIPPGWKKPYHPLAYRPDGSLKRYSRYVHVITNSTPRWAIPLVEQTFKQTAERDIANILMITPGDELVGQVRYDNSFKDRFIASLNHTITFDDENDTQIQKDLKDAVIATKKELKQALDRGEDIVEIMNETRKQFEELSLYRQDIKKMVDEARAANGNELTKKDEEDLIKAANLMLEERGCKPLMLPSAFIEQVEHLDGSTKGQVQ